MKKHLAILTLLGLSMSFSALASPASDLCRDDLPNRIYVKTPSGDQITSNPLYVQPFLKTYDLLPDKAQGFMCKFKKFVLIQTEATAWSSMAFRIGVFDKQLTAVNWMSWKDQLNFGIPNTDDFTVSDQLPKFEMTQETQFIYWVLAHELGHNVPRTSEMSKLWNKSYDGDIGAIPEHNRLCFYWCNGNTIAERDAEGIYNKIFNKSKFLSLYSTRNAEEYWAESFMYYVAFEHGTGIKESIKTPTGVVYSINDRFYSPAFSQERQVLKQAYDQLDKLEPLSHTMTLPIIVE
jgi:hypothetical protein